MLLNNQQIVQNTHKWGDWKRTEQIIVNTFFNSVLDPIDVLCDILLKLQFYVFTFLKDNSDVSFCAGLELLVC